MMFFRLDYLETLLQLRIPIRLTSTPKLFQDLVQNLETK